MSCSCSSSTGLLVGSRPTVTFTITSIDGTLVDPSNLFFTVMHPDGSTDPTYTEADPEVTNPSVGVWAWQPADPLLEAGEWWVYLAADGGGGDVAAEESFVIQDVHVPVGP